MSNPASTEVLARFPRVTKYYYFGGQRVAMRADGVVYYLHGDHLGSTSLVTNESGGEHARQYYYPYGEVRPGGSGTLPTDLTYTGQRNMPGLGLMHYGARFYDSFLGRFVSADTIVPNPRNPQDLNRYAYVRNNPLNYIDPSGHAVDRGGAWGIPWPPPPTPTPPPLPVPTPPPLATPTPLPPSAGASGTDQCLLCGEPDYRGVSVEVGAPTLVMLTGLGLSVVGLPEAGLPVALVGAILDLNPVTGPLAVGGAFEWDRYGHHYGSVQVSWGHAWPVEPVAVNVYGVRIFTESNRPATEEEVTEFVPGISANLGGSALYGGSLVWNPQLGAGFPGTFGLQTGWAFPLQIGGSASIAFQID